MAKKNKTKHLGVEVPIPEYRQIERAAKRERRSVSSFVRNVLAAYLTAGNDNAKKAA